MIVIHHSKDMDGYCSGAICKYKYPEAKLIGWDYKDEIPDFEQFKGEDVIMIDISFPTSKILELKEICNHVTIIDHHISFAKDFYRDILKDSYSETMTECEYIGEKIRYVYKLGKAACEIGWKYLFPDKDLPLGVLLIGRYDTWRQEEGDWKEQTLPFKYYMYGNCNSAENFPKWVLESDMDGYLWEACSSGKEILRYQETMDESIALKNYFVMEEVFGGLTALCINYYPFSSETLKSVWNPEIYDIMVGFAYVGNGKWSISLRSVGDKVDCSVIAKNRGGGGHKNASGFEVNKFEEIFN